MEAKEPLWLNKTKDRVVKGGTPEAASLLYRAGKKITKEDAERYGIGSGYVPGEKPEPKPEPEAVEEKRGEKPENKAGKKGENKSA